jgi:WD40 repeat protein
VYRQYISHSDNSKPLFLKSNAQSKRSTTLKSNRNINSSFLSAQSKMRQISLLPAGCHQCDQSIVYASESKLIYSSKLALYVVNPVTFMVEKIISTQTRSLQSMSVNPNNDNFVACSGMDGIVCIWDLSTEQCTVRFSHSADILAWDPHNPNNCAIVVNRPKIQLYSWCVPYELYAYFSIIALCVRDMRPESLSSKRLFVADSDTVVANVARQVYYYSLYFEITARRCWN